MGLGGCAFPQSAPLRKSQDTRFSGPTLLSQLSITPPAPESPQPGTSSPHLSGFGVRLMFEP